MQKILIVLLVLTSLLVSKDYKNITLVDFIQILSHTTNKNFVISDSVKKDFHIYLPSYDFKNKKLSIKLLNNILELNGLESKNINDVYLIYRPKPKRPEPIEEILPPIEKPYIIKYKYLDQRDIKSFFMLYPEIKNTILKNRIFVVTTEKLYKEVSAQLDMMDNSYLQRNIQITIIGTLNKDAKDIGLDLGALYQDASKYIELVTSKVSFNASLTSTTQFYSFINLMKEKGYTRLLDNPNITLSDKKDAIIESTQNIPYLTSTTSTKDTQTTTQNSYEYKDVGLKVNFTNVVISDTHLDVDLDIYIQSILEQSITPVIGSRHVQTHITLDKNSSVVLGGLSSSLEYKRNTNIPIIEYVPLLNQITEHKKTEVKDETFTIIISN